MKMLKGLLWFMTTLFLLNACGSEVIKVQKHSSGEAQEILAASKSKLLDVQASLQNLQESAGGMDAADVAAQLDAAKQALADAQGQLADLGVDLDDLDLDGLLDDVNNLIADLKASIGDLVGNLGF